MLRASREPDSNVDRLAAWYGRRTALDRELCEQRVEFDERRGTKTGGWPIHLFEARIDQYTFFDNLYGASRTVFEVIGDAVDEFLGKLRERHYSCVNKSGGG